jgi:amidohydrolase
MAATRRFADPMTSHILEAPTPEQLNAAAQALLPEAVELRRQLHAQPEIGLELPQTQAAIIEALGGLGLDITTGRTCDAVVAILDGARQGPTTLLRADMDALPLTERTGLDYASRVDGVMHACGHDAHTAMLAAAAKLIAANRDGLAGRVVFMFQPGEEGHDGARAMLSDGLIDLAGPVDRAFAVHVTQLVPAGSVTIRPGPMLASSDHLEIVVTGAGGHGSMPHDAIDPVTVACELVGALQTMITRRIPAFDPAVVTVGAISAGTASNIIPETALLDLTVRAVSERSRTLALDGVYRVAEHVAAAHLCHASVRSAGPRFPVTVNDDAVAARVHGISERLLGADRTSLLATPIMGAEDWAYVLQEVRGAMAFLGAASADSDPPAPNHSNRMLLHEPSMAAGIALHAAVAFSPAISPAPA